VDPQFIISDDVIGKKPALQVFQETSDAFFAKRDLEGLLGGPVDLAFLDGMHLFEYLLRDFFNTERYCRRNSVIVLHDCAPCDEFIATRSPQDPKRRNSKNPGWWAGDAWKMLPILKQFRPDITIYVLDSVPTGLVVVTNLDPDSRILTDNYYRILDEFRDLTLDGENFDRFINSIDFIDAAEFTEFTRISRYLWL
jgi:hypothetical protein